MPKENVLAITTTYEQNEWLSDEDKELFEDMKKTDYQRYLVVDSSNGAYLSDNFLSR